MTKRKLRNIVIIIFSIILAIGWLQRVGDGSKDLWVEPVVITALIALIFLKK